MAITELGFLWMTKFWKNSRKRHLQPSIGTYMYFMVGKPPEDQVLISGLKDVESDISATVYWQIHKICKKKKRMLAHLISCVFFLGDLRNQTRCPILLSKLLNTKAKFGGIRHYCPHICVQSFNARRRAVKQPKTCSAL